MTRLDDIGRDLTSIAKKINNHVYAPGQLEVVVMRSKDAKHLVRVGLDLLDLVERAVPMVEAYMEIIAAEWGTLTRDMADEELQFLRDVRGEEGE
jgi:hypothetical protein